MNKYKLLNAIESAIENGIRYKIGKWDDKVLTIYTDKHIYGLSMTDPDKKNDFPNGCILVAQTDRTVQNDLYAIDWGESSMIGKWIDYNYGFTDEMADYIYKTIAEEEGDYWYDNAYAEYNI